MMTFQAKRVQVARTMLLLDQPFFGVLALGLQVTEDPTCDTAWTDGQSLGYSPMFIDTLSDSELQTVIAHEVMHCAAGHPWRRDHRDPAKWNVAADYAINSVLDEAGFSFPVQSPPLLDPAYLGRWAEWIYDRLPDPPPDASGSGQSGQPGSAGAPGLGEVRDAPAGAESSRQADWQQQVQVAKRAAGRGHLPASLQERIDTLTASHVDWRSLLRRYAQETARADYSWTRPNARYLASGLYLPALHSKVCGRLAIGVDTSGSIDTVLLQQFGSEIQAIADDLQPSAIDVLYCDRKVHRVDRYERGDAITLSAIGRGGTSFVPVFDRIAADGEQPAVLIYLTDLDGTFPDAAPDYPVIWAAYGGRTEAPFGDVVPCA